MTKVEEVARALMEWDGLDYKVMARAAIVAMQEPTEKMANAPDDISPCEAREIWHAMISAALSEGEG